MPCISSDSGCHDIDKNKVLENIIDNASLWQSQIDQLIELQNYVNYIILKNNKESLK